MTAFYLRVWRSLFGWVGGAGMAVFMYAFLLVPTERYPVGTLNRDGYETGGLIASGVMLLAILVSALGTHHRIALLAEPSLRATSGLRGVFSEVLETTLSLAPNLPARCTRSPAPNMHVHSACSRK